MTNFMGDIKCNCFIGSNNEIPSFVQQPFVFRNNEMFFQNGFRSDVVNVKTVCNCLEICGCLPLCRRGVRLVDHKCSVTCANSLIGS